MKVENGYEFLVEKQEMWAKMLMQALQNEGIPCVGIPVHGAGMVTRTLAIEILKVYVPAECVKRAREINEQLFGEGN